MIDSEYQRGYYDGYKEGYNKALEYIQEQLQLAIASRPIQIKIKCNRENTWKNLVDFEILK